MQSVTQSSRPRAARELEALHTRLVAELDLEQFAAAHGMATQLAWLSVASDRYAMLTMGEDFDPRQISTTLHPAGP